MNIEDPIALHFIIQEELYLLNNDKSAYSDAGILPPSVKQTEAAEINYLGGKKKDFLVLVHYPGHEFLAEAHLAALENILKRKGYTIDDVAILNLAKHAAFNFYNIIDYFNPQKILFLGENALPRDTAPIGFNLPQQLGDRAALYSFSFDEMMDNTDNKKAFWDQMKIF